MTVSELMKHCLRQIQKGNGDKFVLISDDDEGNGFHELFYQFTDDEEEVDKLLESTCSRYNEDKYYVILG